MKNFFLFLLCFAAFTGYAQQIAIYEFNYPQQVESEDGFSELLFDNCHYINEEGLPDLPVFGANMLVEPGHEIVSILIKNIEYYPAIENINIRPAAANFPISKGAPANYKAVPNPEIYNANQNYPVNIVGGENTSFLRGHAIGSFLISPVQYNPVQKRAKPVKSITLEIYSQPTAKATEALKFLRNDHDTEKRLTKIGVNRNESIAKQYQGLNTRNEQPNYDILVITKASFVGALDEYIHHKNLWGYKILVKTVEEISTAYTDGIDEAENMRNCVIDAYNNDGISYLMLFGDSHPNSNSQHNIIPYRKLYGKVSSSSGPVEDNLPSDMYFACLDGTWYNEADGSWGKPGYEDLTHEISVGRICADSVDDIETFVEKLIKYQETPVVADITKALMVGEQLDDITYGGTSKDIVASGGSFNGYTTTGIPSNFIIDKLYERDLGNWSTNQLRNYFNNTGVHIINHFGHAHVTYSMKLSNWDITNAKFTNTNAGDKHSLAIVYSQGCLNGAFDNIDDYGWDVGEDCINEMFHKINGGVVANIGNSRYGWYSGGNTNGASQRFDRYFFDGIFGQDIYTIGDANSYSKDVNKSYIYSNSVLRWCCYELNLMGDPSMDIWTDTPTNVDPLFVKAFKNSDTEFFINTEVSYARVAVLQNNELISRGVCDKNGEVTLYFDTPFDTDAVTFSISGHNKFRYERRGLPFDFCEAIDHIDSAVNRTTITLSWEEPAIAPQKYTVLRDGEFLIETTQPLISDEVPEEDTEYEYCVIANYENCNSEPTCIVVKSGVLTGISEPSVQQIRVYPHPVYDLLYIETGDTSIVPEVKIYSVQGILLMDVKGDRIDVSSLPQGIYIANINGVCLKVVKL